MKHNVMADAAWALLMLVIGLVVLVAAGWAGHNNRCNYLAAHRAQNPGQFHTYCEATR